MVIDVQPGVTLLAILVTRGQRYRPLTGGSGDLVKVTRTGDLIRKIALDWTLGIVPGGGVDEMIVDLMGSGMVEMRGCKARATSGGAFRRHADVIGFTGLASIIRETGCRLRCWS